MNDLLNFVFFGLFGVWIVVCDKIDIYLSGYEVGCLFYSIM